MISSYTQDLYYETNIHFKKRGVNSYSRVRYVAVMLALVRVTS